MNICILQGRLVREVEMNYISEDKVCAEFSVAVTRDYPNRNGVYETDFIKCVMWGKRAEILARNIHVGERIMLKGAIRVKSYDDKNGIRRVGSHIIVYDFDFMERVAYEDYWLRHSFNDMMSA